MHWARTQPLPRTSLYRCLIQLYIVAREHSRLAVVAARPPPVGVASAVQNFDHSAGRETKVSLRLGSVVVESGAGLGLSCWWCAWCWRRNWGSRSSSHRRAVRGNALGQRRRRVCRCGRCGRLVAGALWTLVVSVCWLCCLGFLILNCHAICYMEPRFFTQALSANNTG